jgi:tetratricopeptide (TPR) repeat protein
MKNKYTYVVIIFLIVASCAAFGQIARNDFINLDDTGYITENPQIKSGINLQTIKWASTAVVISNWHPLTLLSHTLDWSMFGANASGHHLVSLLLHILAVIFLFLFFNKTTKSIWPAAFAAALFALHPLRVESVAWASERKDVLSMFFGMTALYAYAFYAENFKLSKYFLCLVLFALSLMSKPMLVTLPFVLLLLDYWPLGRWQKALSDMAESRYQLAGRLVWEKAPLFLLTIASSIITFWAQKKEGSIASEDILPLIMRATNAIVSYVAYLDKTFWPFNLAVFYPYEFSLPLWKILILGLILIVITASVLYYIRKLPFLFVGWFWYLGTLIPVIGLVQVGTQGMADRYTYMPSIGIAIMLAWGISSLIKNENIRKKILFPAAIAILFVLAILTWTQCGYWKDSITLFRQTLSVTRNNDKIHDNLGSVFLKQNKIREAIYHYNRAISLKPYHYGYYNDRGNAYANLGMYQPAIDDFNKAISLKPDYVETYYNRGTFYGRIGQYQLAIVDLNKAISLKPDYIKAYNNRGIVYTKLNLYQMAIDDFNKAISLKPDYIDAYNNRAFIYLSQGNIVSGCRDAQKACVLGNCRTLEWTQSKVSCR